MSDKLALFPGVKLTRTSLQLTKRMSYEAWEQIGVQLRVVEGSIQWWIGDWLNEGERAYGEKYAQAVDEKEADLWKQYSFVSAHVEKLIRINDLAWSHHREVASLPTEKQSQWLKEAAENEWSVREFRTELRKAKLLAADSGVPPGTYRIIYADPPWEYSDERGGLEDYTAAVDHYPTMTLAELSAMKLPKVADQAALFMWATSPLLPDALELTKAWGFEYKASFVWDKVKHNYGHYNSVRHELLLIATKGSCTPEAKDLFDSVQVIERAEHSRKPEKFRQMIDHLYPQKNGIDRIELFRRGGSVLGWDVWGNETT